MLSDLIALKNASVSITTSDSGQVNLAIFTEGKTPLAMTFSAEQSYQAEQEIKSYCAQAQPVTTTSNSDDGVVSEAKPQEAVSKPVAAEAEQPEQPEQSLPTFEDDLANEFGL